MNVPSPCAAITLEAAKRFCLAAADRFSCNSVLNEISLSRMDSIRAPQEAAGGEMIRYEKCEYKKGKKVTSISSPRDSRFVIASCKSCVPIT